MTFAECVACGARLQTHWLKHGACNACRNPESVVVAVTDCEHMDLDHGICLDCGADRMDALILKAEAFYEIDR